MTRIWPDPKRPDELVPDHPFHRAVAAALTPLEPVLRAVQYTTDGAVPHVTFGFGPPYHLASVRLLEEATALLDLPVGEVIHTVPALTALLEHNRGGAWHYRVDGVSRGDPGQVTVVIEHRMPLADLPDLPGRVLGGWQEKLVRLGMLQALNDAGGGW